MERMRTIPVDLILHELATRLADLPDTHHRDLHRAPPHGRIRPPPPAPETTAQAPAIGFPPAYLPRRRL